MFKKEDVEAYRKITAPSWLRTKIMMAEKSGRFLPYHRLYLAAACLAVIMSLTLMWDWTRSTAIIYENEKSASLASHDSRDLEKTSISLVFSSSHKRRVVVSEGSLTYQDAKNGEFITSGSEIWIDGDAELIWKLDGQMDEDYVLKVTGWGRDINYLLNYNQENETWQIKEQ